MNLIQFMFTANAARKLLLEQMEVIHAQRLALRVAAKKIAQWQDLALDTTRSMRDLAISYRVAQEQPEVDIREDLDQIVRELDDQMARLTEQIVQ